MKNYYEILQIDKKADLETIQRIYKYHIKKNHPDLYQGREKTIAKEKVQLLNEAYEVLSDEQKRKEYDEMLALEEQSERLDSDNIKRLQHENEILKEEIFQKEKTIQKISNEYQIPFDDKIKSKYNNSTEMQFNNLAGKNIVKRYLWYFGISFFKIIFIILIFAFVLLMLSSVTGRNYFNFIK